MHVLPKKYRCSIDAWTHEYWERERTFLGRRCPKSGPWRSYRQHERCEWRIRRQLWILTRRWTHCGWIETIGLIFPRRNLLLIPPWTGNHNRRLLYTPPSYTINIFIARERERKGEREKEWEKGGGIAMEIKFDFYKALDKKKSLISLFMGLWECNFVHIRKKWKINVLLLRTQHRHWWPNPDIV